ncbi:adenylate/guanylate cyclase domain-containing protein [Geminicoccaceae bacterium 1502E]|nr:adenylate/guanylate cyclase domain-containing protein [Geminicoccaceae bacterium 1502E]
MSLPEHPGPAGQSRQPASAPPHPAPVAAAEAAAVVLPDLTVMFADLGGSSALYHRLGDGAAFALVRRHLGVLRQGVLGAGGTVVKTIGDAVMAVFPEAAAAMRAALAALAETERQPLAPPGIAPLRLKIGIHRGPVIAAALEAGPDFFGHTVNVAARLCSLAGAGGICLGAEAGEAAGAAGLLAGLEVDPASAPLAGLEGPPIAVLRLRLPSPGALGRGAAA